MAQSPAIQLETGPASAPRVTLGGRAAILLGLAAYVAVLGAVSWWALQWLPDRLSFKAFGHAVTVKEVHRRLVSNGLLVFCLLPLALWIECAAVGWRQSSIRQLL